MTRLAELSLPLTLLGVALALYGTLMPTNPLSANAFGGDKVQHALAFGLLTLPTAVLRPRRLWWLLPALLMLGAGIEWGQEALGRGGDIKDWLANGLGMAVALVLAAGLRLTATRVIGPRLRRAAGRPG